MDWKKPVRDYIPEFRLHDAVATDRVTVRDLLCHHSGLPRHDWVWVPGDLSPAQMLAAMRYLEPSDDIRSTHQYSNLGYLVAGMVAERVSGQSWTEFTRARLIDKLHMNVTFTAEDLVAAPDAAMPYEMDGDTRLRTKLWPVRATAAGGINTSIASFANWLRLHLDRGEFEGQRHLSPTLIRELQTPRVHVAAAEFAEYSDVHYGLGFRSHRYRGERVVWHSGGWFGWSTLMTMLTDRGVGVAVFTNRNPNPVTEILANHVFDPLCGKEPIPWLDRLREQRHKALAQLEIDREAPKATRRLNTRPSHDLADYAGDYDHPSYGRIAITHAEGQLNWAYRGMSSRSRTGTTIRSSCPRRPAACCPIGSPSHFPPTVKETLRVWRLRSSRSSKTSSSPALQPAIARARPSVSTAPARSATEAPLLLSGRTRMDS